jgi:hypothetical protein
MNMLGGLSQVGMDFQSFKHEEIVFPVNCIIVTGRKSTYSFGDNATAKPH